MDNKQIVKTLKLTIQLMELHEENTFKIRSFQSALNSIERDAPPLVGLDQGALQEIGGIGKSIAEVIREIIATGTHRLLMELLEQTPEGILEVLTIKGLGPKKVKALWKELHITSVHELMEACQAGQIAKLKGFGEKTQQSIIYELEFIKENKGKWLYADVEEGVEGLLAQLANIFGAENVTAVGEYARKSEIVSTVEVLVCTDSPKEAMAKISSIDTLTQVITLSSPYRFGGYVSNYELRCDLLMVSPAHFVREKLLRKANRAHLHALVREGEVLAHVFQSQTFKNEEEAYRAAGLAYVPEELREGRFEIELAQADRLPELLEFEDIRGPLHNHSSYSDGKHTLREMAEFCQSLGYEYLGMADHSQSAFYANGLKADRVAKQQEEIDELNNELAPFKIFKGIESDILIDGSLDYAEDTLKSFDYVVASVHSSLSMDIDKATARLLRAIQNPYTTILGHPTGRLLLRREGYPIDHKVVIDACAEYGVAIEINANPWRLDLDWRWVNYALEKGVKLSINPDAHEKQAFSDMRYGVFAGRKGGLTKEMTLNAMPLNELEAYFRDRKNLKR